jgi:serine/threonine protein kinase
MTGQTISHYRIAEKLGEGGMGVVYKAEDMQLRRTVALKFLTPQALSESETKARLIREAQAAASLDHPHICSVYGIHEEDGRTFIAMAYIDGVSLADKIKQRPLALDEALKVAIQTGEGLQEAHEQGIVHRDIKPANIMLTRKGQVKIMDFGLAYLTGRSKLTKSGTTLGTPVYMSPEQALGQAADRRSDIWSLGVVLYEMLAGKPPFESEYTQAIVYSIINEPPEPLTARRTGLPVEIDRIINKVLAKKPDERYQHVDDLGVDLKNLQEKLKPGRLAVPSAATPAERVDARPAVPDRTETATDAPEGPAGPARTETHMIARAQHAVPLRPSMRERIAWALVAVLLGLCIWLASAAWRGPA